MSGAQGIKASNSSWEGDFPRYRSSFRKVRVGYSIPCWSARWPCTPESPLPIEPASIHPGFLARHPFKSPFAPISQIAEGQLFEIWEYYLIFRRGWLGGWLLSAYVTASSLPISSTPIGAARSRPGRQVGDSYQAQKLLACSNQRDTTYSPFTLTCYLRPRRWAMPGGLGHLCIGTGLVASLSAAKFSPPLVSSMYRIGRVREPTYWYKPRSVSVCRH